MKKKQSVYRVKIEAVIAYDRTNLEDTKRAIAECEALKKSVDENGAIVVEKWDAFPASVVVPE